MRILVTGGLGNVGLFTIQMLMARGYTVRCFDLPTPRNQKVARQTRLQVEWQWGDIQNPTDVEKAVQHVDVIIHLASIIPPLAYDTPELAESVNVGGMRNLIDAAQRQTPKPRMLFTSSLAVFGPTTHLPPPRRVGDPLVGTDNYSHHKIECEALLQQSTLEWSIFRMGDMVIQGGGRLHPIIFELPLNTRIHKLHPKDAAVALTHALTAPQIWQKIWLIGGDQSCQVYYGEYLKQFFDKLGLPMLPEAAFSTKPYYTDWLDTTESQAILNYQQRSYEDFLRDAVANVGPVRFIMPLMRKLIIRDMLKLSPYWKSATERT